MTFSVNGIGVSMAFSGFGALTRTHNQARKSARRHSEARPLPSSERRRCLGKKPGPRTGETGTGSWRGRRGRGRSRTGAGFLAASSLRRCSGTGTLRGPSPASRGRRLGPGPCDAVLAVDSCPPAQKAATSAAVPSRGSAVASTDLLARPQVCIVARSGLVVSLLGRPEPLFCAIELKGPLQLQTRHHAAQSKAGLFKRRVVVAPPIDHMVFTSLEGLED